MRASIPDKQGDQIALPNEDETGGFVCGQRDCVIPGVLCDGNGGAGSEENSNGKSQNAKGKERKHRFNLSHLQHLPFDF